MKSEHDPQPPRSRRVPVTIVAGTLGVLVLGVFLVRRAGSRVNDVALASTPKLVTVTEARAARYRSYRRYVGTIQPWVEAKIGPQLISAYVDTVLVRPGDVVKRGQVIATLDCRNASASSKAVAMQARALQAQQEALAHEAARVAELKEGGFASPNEIEKHAAESASKEAELMETQARMQRATLEVDDCVMRAPFAGEVAQRLVDPGAFIRPGAAVASIVDRNTVRVIAEVPEADFEVVGPRTTVQMMALATRQSIEGAIARRSPAADLATRTVHIEIDVPDPERALPVGTTAELTVDVGQPQPATELPLVAASLRGQRATVYTVDAHQRAHKGVFQLLGERAGSVFVEPTLAPGSRVVIEGRTLLKDGDTVAAKLEPMAPPRAEVQAGVQLAGVKP